MSRLEKFMDKMEDWATIALLFFISFVSVIIEIIIVVVLTIWFIGYAIKETIKEKFKKGNE